ncbi:MAG: hypothetical protein OEW77_00635 [Gemmatimonadota bacterium]|nr:hypothetical protein [Gemmatimonadota bacterium]
MSWHAGHGIPARVVLALVSCVLGASVGCSRRTLSAFFDLPQAAPAAAPAPTAATPATAAVARPPEAAGELPRPVFEGTLDPDSAIKLLPRDHAGNIDWVRAAVSGVIRPREALSGRLPADSSQFQFGFDFLFPGPDTLFDAFFPHSTHTQLLSCATCHPRIFPHRDNPIKMGDILSGRYCGECHGKVSFPVVTGCERCHIRLQLPPDRAKPELIGTVTLLRVSPDSLPDGVVPGNSAGVTTRALPSAVFPHWVHRARYACKSCHMELFIPVAGANRITMKDISAGKACGACHDGRTAFAAGFGACQRCHPAPSATEQPVPPPSARE